MLIFNPYDLNHVAMLSDWLEDKKKGINRDCPFYTSAQLMSMMEKKKKKQIKLKGLLKAK